MRGTYVRLGRGPLVILLLAVLVPLAAQGRSDGIARADGCDNCHGNTATGSLNVSVSGSATLLPNEVATYTLTIDQLLEGGAFYVEELNISGAVGVVDANTRLINGGVSHLDALTSAPAGNIGDWSYNFSVTAPGVAGTTMTLSFVGMAFNGIDRADPGDIWNAGTFLISVVPEPATALLVALGIGMLAASGRRRGA